MKYETKNEKGGFEIKWASKYDAMAVFIPKTQCKLGELLEKWNFSGRYSSATKKLKKIISASNNAEFGNWEVKIDHEVCLYGQYIPGTIWLYPRPDSLPSETSACLMEVSPTYKEVE